MSADLRRMSRTAVRVSFGDLAEAAGCSVKTAIAAFDTRPLSQVPRGKRVSLATGLRIMQVAETINFRPYRVAILNTKGGGEPC